MISVIIPTLNEERVIGSSLRSLLSCDGEFEIIVADGGSTDKTLDVTGGCPGVRHVVSEKGRGAQMNAGASAARGDILLFLHADTLLPRCAFQRITAAMADRSVVGGCFRLSFDLQSFLLKGFSLVAGINHILFTYGDQGLFMAARTFNAIGGYKSIPIMEDVEIQRRLRPRGRFVKLDVPVVTSARRFIRRGIIRQQALNTTLVSLYYVGVSPSLLKRFYR
jgi:rSAM/selenodomain-associated transferase 2